MNLIVAQFDGLRRQRADARTSREWIGPCAPAQPSVAILAEALRKEKPIDSLRRSPERWDSDGL
jgi:hypothetical protein